MNSKVNLLLLFLTSSACVALAQNATTQSPAPAGPTPPHELVIQVEVPAPLHAVWQAFTTSDGLSTWLTPDAVVDLRAGGEWTAHFPGGSTGGGTIVSFVPEKEIVISALAPDQFPHVRAERTRAVFQSRAATLQWCASRNPGGRADPNGRAPTNTWSPAMHSCCRRCTCGS